jgi:hypothetical protein
LKVAIGSGRPTQSTTPNNKYSICFIISMLLLTFILGEKPMGLPSEQNIFYGNKPMGLCTNKLFFSSFKMRLKIHF